LLRKVSKFSYDDISGNNGNSSYKLRLFPDEVGSYWLYETYQLDTLNLKVEDSKTYDSVVVENELIKAGKNAKLFSTYSKSSFTYQKSSENFYTVEDKKLLTLQIYLSKFFSRCTYSTCQFLKYRVDNAY